MPLLDFIVGKVEVLERRPRTWNEPRRRRLQLVRPRPDSEHTSSKERRLDDWALAPAQGTGQRYRNDAETWDLRRYEAQKRFGDQAHRESEREHRQKIDAIHRLYGPPPDLQQIFDSGRRQGMIDSEGIEEIRPRHLREHGEDEDEIIDVLDLSEDELWNDHHGEHGRRGEPLVIEPDHDGRDMFEDLGHGKGKKTKSKGEKKDKKKKDKKDGKSKKAKEKHMSDTDDDNLNNRAFVDGVRAGIRAGKERHSKSPGRPRFLDETFSDDSMDSPSGHWDRARGRSSWAI